MTRKLTATEAKSKLLALLDEAGAGEEFEITKHGRTVAKISPASGSAGLRGSMQGVAMTSSSEEDLFATGAEWDLG
jgi:prevent-host-death family protein